MTFLHSTILPNETETAPQRAAPSPVPFTIKRVAPSLASPLSKSEKRSRAINEFWRLPQLFQLWHLASFDAPTVAVVWALAFAQAAGMRLQPWIAVLLFSGTWTVYVGDRLLDGYRAIGSGQTSSLRERHFFHWRHRHTLIALAACTAVLAFVLIASRMPVAIRERNSVLAAAAVMYFSGVHSSSRFPAWLRKVASKELLVGILFTAGCAAPAFSQMHFAAAPIVTRWPLIICFVFFAILAWCNCRAIEGWESTSGENKVLLHAGLLSIAGALISVVLLFVDTAACELMAAATASSLLLLLLGQMRLKMRALTSRILADAVLLTPAVLLAFGLRR